ncbi:MAG: hypothetical protein KHW59_08290 [Clostridiales bacterium]|nr:hypothetical protein [Clostridiales bacterium]
MKKNEIYVCFVRHEEGGQQYLFDCTKFRYDIWPGVSVDCDTSRGITNGTAVSGPIRIEGASRDIEMLIKAIGGYTPLREILYVEQKQTYSLTEEERAEIAKKWLKDKLDSDLPF